MSEKHIIKENSDNEKENSISELYDLNSSNENNNDSSDCNSNNDFSDYDSNDDEFSDYDWCNDETNENREHSGSYPCKRLLYEFSEDEENDNNDSCCKRMRLASSDFSEIEYE